MFTVTLNHDLHIAIFHCIHKHVCQARLYGWMQMDFWLLQKNDRSFRHVITKNQYGQYLRYSETHVSYQYLGGRIRLLYSYLINVISLCNWLDFEIVYQAKFLEPMCDPFFEGLFLTFVTRRNIRAFLLRRQ